MTMPNSLKDRELRVFLKMKGFYQTQVSNYMFFFTHPKEKDLYIYWFTNFRLVEVYYGIDNLQYASNMSTKLLEGLNTIVDTLNLSD